MAITIRSVKGSALSHAELDANFTTLDGNDLHLASSAEVLTGTDDTKACSPLGVFSAYSQINIATLPTTDHSCIGPTITALNAGGSITVLNLVILNSSSQWVQTDANTAATYAGLLGIAMESKTSGQAMKVALPMTVIKDSSWAWTPGKTLYMSETAAGITDTPPTTTNSATIIIGYAVTATVIYFKPDNMYITHT